MTPDLIQLPARCSTAAAEDMLALVLESRKRDMPIRIDASGVTSIGQAVLQLLIVARRDFVRRGQDFVIADPSEAFLAAVRMSGCEQHLEIEAGA